MSPRRALLAMGAGALLGLSACTAKAPLTAPAGGVDESAAGGDRDDASLRAADLSSLELELDRSWEELRTLEDSREPASVEAGAAGPGDVVDRCERIRGLADRICVLSDRVCALADEHPGEERYTSACGRGRDTCTQATEAADRCAAG
ncbi:hypothetical protein [Paraliomyxa miuraensis]|uniref:hypothetical protein n=1 Tax=Paraliomyxa miuraensis TaxID=376150 RepID=UPI002252D990|nr:hypothetical protein [Paraliomyxa miuraensis]MCX4241440.1 hypothetical protein [Paraliomyxa miuraensis]